MPPMSNRLNQDELAKHLELLSNVTQTELDELLRDLLERVYPTKLTQDS